MASAVEVGLNIADEGMDVVLAPIVSTQYLKYSSTLKALSVEITYTDCIDYFEADVIVAIKSRGTIPMFAYVFCFPIEVWALILLSLIVLSLISSIDHKLVLNYKKISKHFRNYFVLLLSKPLERLVFQSTSKQILIVWLFSALVLSNQFTTYLMDFMIRAIPELRIDTLEQLSKQKNMKLAVREDSTFFDYINETETPTNKILRNKLKPYDSLNDFVNELTNGLRNGTMATINKRNIIIFILMEVRESQKKLAGNNDQSLSDLLHFSKKLDFYEPYFLVTNNKSAPWIKDNLNIM